MAIYFCSKIILRSAEKCYPLNFIVSFKVNCRPGIRELCRTTCSGFLNSIRLPLTDIAISPPGLFQILITTFLSLRPPYTEAEILKYKKFIHFLFILIKKQMFTC